MKKIVLIIALCLLSIVNFAQVDGSILQKDIQIKYTPLNPDGDVRLQISTSKDTIRLFYWIYKYENGVKIFSQRKTDCYIPWNKNQTYKDTYIQFNAWIRNKYNIE